MEKINLTEIRWHGRGGQGAKTACLLLADAAFDSGKHVQGFPEYGPERMGAPITAYNRISDRHCDVHSNIYYPNYVVVVDETLLNSVDVTSGLSKEGTLIVNTKKTPKEIREKVNGFQGKIGVVDATSISIETIGSNFPNTPMLAATIKITNLIETNEFLRDMEESLKYKFSKKPHLIAGNMAAFRKSIEEVIVG
ncbi:MAG: pyruvate synthase [Clostridiales bacterium]|nr:pyruvate synthase [Clostridiales bacterium]